MKKLLFLALIGLVIIATASAVKQSATKPHSAKHANQGEEEAKKAVAEAKKAVAEAK